MQSYPITAEIRRELAHPLGTLIHDSEISREALRRFLDRATFVVSVGDRTTERVEELGFTPHLEIIDLKEQRRPKFTSLQSKTKLKIVRVSNHPGSISAIALKRIKKILKDVEEDSEQIIRLVVDGEEDLLVLPIAAFFPKGTAVLYGQPNVGMVIVSSSKSREKARKILANLGIKSLRNF